MLLKACTKRSSKFTVAIVCIACGIVATTKLLKSKTPIPRFEDEIRIDLEVPKEQFPPPPFPGKIPVTIFLAMFM